MKKRILIPGAAIGGILIYLASQFLSLNLGDLGVPSGTKMISVEDDSSASKTHQPMITEDGRVVQTVEEVPREKVPERLLLVDVLIDGEHFNVNRVTNEVDEVPIERQPASVEEIIAMVEKAEGDKSGTRVRVSRTPEAIASAETRLMEALQTAGVSSDDIDRRSRLVEKP